MADKDENQKRENAHRQTERRDQMAFHGLRALLILNGGGAVALLAFLQAIWDKPTAASLVPYILGGMIPLILGAAASGWVHFIRYQTISMDFAVAESSSINRARMKIPLCGGKI
ncbi:MAG: hypothetical protein O7B98_09140 [Alphaproteobacteria bacterium]|nr:hypothetical protein [Alphaproteobacteria bacterium]